MARRALDPRSVAEARVDRIRNPRVATVDREMQGHEPDAVERRIGGLVPKKRLKLFEKDVFESVRAMPRGIAFTFF